MIKITIPGIVLEVDERDLNNYLMAGYKVVKEPKAKEEKISPASIEEAPEAPKAKEGKK